MHCFSDRLAIAIQTKRTPLIVGLDPRLEQLPAALQSRIDPRDVAAVSAAFESFCIELLDVVAPLVPAIKPQWAFFEQLGSPGLAALERVIASARSRGLLIIADAKRGDIGSTAEAYAGAFFRDDKGPTFCDAVTVNPYLGMDTLQPFIDAVHRSAVGLFVLVKTSNPGSGDFQDLSLAGGERLYEAVADKIQAVNATQLGQCSFGNIGAVVGATYPQQLAELRQRMPNTWLLIPGFGAQGGTASDTSAAFDQRGLGAVVNSSRAIIFAYRDKKYAAAGESRWQDAVAAACRDSIEQLRAETAAGVL